MDDKNENKGNTGNVENSGWHQLATEIVAGIKRESKAKDFAIGCLTMALIVVALGMAIINYRNDTDWRELFASYDYVSQDGNGQNYYNADIGGDVTNGAENQTEEE